MKTKIVKTLVNNPEFSAVLSIFWLALTLLIIFILTPNVFIQYYAYGPFAKYSSYFHTMFFGFLAAMGFLTISIFKINGKIRLITVITLWIALIIESIGVLLAFYKNGSLVFSTNASELLFVSGFILFAFAALFLIIGLVIKGYKERFTPAIVLLIFLISSMFLMAHQGLQYGDEAIGGAHSHSIASFLIVAIVAVTMCKFGFDDLKGKLRATGLIGLVIMCFGIVTAFYLYTLASIFGKIPFGDSGYPGPPVLFAFGAGGVNGIAMDDMATFLAGIGASLIGFALIYHQKKLGNYTSVRQMFKKDSVKFALPFAFFWTVLGLVVPGFLIELNEVYYQNGGINFAQSFAHWHLMFMFSMITITIMYLIYEVTKPKGKILRVNLEHSAEWGNRLMFIGYILTPFFINPYVFTLSSTIVYITAIPIAFIVIGLMISAISNLVDRSLINISYIKP